jgi:hypothetical protein
MPNTTDDDEEDDDEDEDGNRGMGGQSGSPDAMRKIKRERKRKIMGHKKVQNPLARPPEVPYIRRPFSRSRD